MELDERELLGSREPLDSRLLAAGGRLVGQLDHGGQLHGQVPAGVSGTATRAVRLEALLDVEGPAAVEAAAAAAEQIDVGGTLVDPTKLIADAARFSTCEGRAAQTATEERDG